MKSKPKAAATAVSRRYTAVLRVLKREVARREEAQTALAESERHYRQMLERSRRTQEQSRRLSHELLSAQEAERKRISRELHDQIGQTLIAINVKLAILKKEATVNIAGLKKTLAGTQRLLDQSMSTVHRFAREMRPPLLDDLGLTPALQSYTKDFTKRTGIPIRLTAFAAVERLDGEKRLVLYRVVQEALANVAKHAHATSVGVSIRKHQSVVRMDIHDDGKAFRVEDALDPTRHNRLGLVGMRERLEMVGGSFSVESAPGKGTTVRATIPIGKRGRRSAGARRRSAK